MTAWADNPQAAQIDALIERAGRLTAVECERLVAVRFAVRFAAWVAGRGAGRDAAVVAARVAARDAAWEAAWFAARAAAWVAARAAATAAAALVVRDLIDEATPWNRAAYDLLTGPWRRVIGPVHPDDEVLR